VTDASDVSAAAEGVYAPKYDSQLLIDVMEKTGLATRHRVADLCVGSGVVAVAAAAGVLKTDELPLLRCFERVRSGDRNH
jgi:methylase of polypeptide subunit release factors